MAPERKETDAAAARRGHDYVKAPNGFGGLAPSRAEAVSPTRPPGSAGGVPEAERNTPSDQPDSTLEKDPDDWVTGEESMTGPQASYLRTLCQEAGEPFDEGLTKAEASRRIDELQSRTGRGRPSADAA